MQMGRLFPMKCQAILYVLPKLLILYARTDIRQIRKKCWRSIGKGKILQNTWNVYYSCYLGNIERAGMYTCAHTILYFIA